MSSMSVVLPRGQELSEVKESDIEGAAYYYSARGTHPRWSNQVVAWSQLELVKYNVTNIMKEMRKPYLVISGENAWSKPSPALEETIWRPGNYIELVFPVYQVRLIKAFHQNSQEQANRHAL